MANKSSRKILAAAIAVLALGACSPDDNNQKATTASHVLQFNNARIIDEFIKSGALIGDCLIFGNYIYI